MAIVKNRLVVSTIARVIRGYSLAGAALFLGAGCVASFPEHQVAKLSRVAIRDASVYKPSVSLSVEFYFDTGTRLNKHRRSQAFQGLVARVTDESGMFRRYTINGTDRDNWEYAIKLTLINHGSINAAIAAGVISGASLGLIPTTVTDHFKLTASVADRANQVIKEYELNEAVTSWIGFWSFFPTDESAERKVFYDVWENMLRNVYQQIADDHLFSSGEQQPTVSQ